MAAANKRSVSRQTVTNWGIDAVLFGGALVAFISGIYFLYLPTGGYQGGRNPSYGVTILFTRHTWDDLHTWGGVAMIAAALVHLVIHWPWVTSMARRVWMHLAGGGSAFSHGARVNVLLDAVVALSFLVAAISSLPFLFETLAGGAIWSVVPWSSVTWDVIHTLSGTVLIVTAVLHFAIHWKWVTKVTARVIGSLGARDASAPAAGRVSL